MRQFDRRLMIISCAAVLLASGGTALAQRARIEAVAGEPFGVGRIILPASAATVGDPWGDGRIDVTERSGRVLYPVLVDGPVRQLFRQILQIRRNVVVHFLFTGTEPLDITATVPDAVPIQIRPTPYQPGLHRGLLSAWWREYSRGAQQRARSGEYPGVIDNYLTSTLARRLSLPAPNLEVRKLLSLTPPPDDGLELLLGTERMKGKIQRRGLLASASASAAPLLPLPPEPAWPLAQFPEVEGEVEMEPMASFVPETFFYLRTGTYANYVWMQEIMDEWGDVKNMITERGVDHGINDKTERLLGLEDTKLSRMFGGTIISDVAFVGSDPFFEEGPAMGMLFEAKSNLLVAQSLSKQRADAAARENGRAVETTVDIDGRQISYVYTPDGALNSYYAMAGDYHLVTTSRSMVRQFLAVAKAKGAGSLAASAGYRYARSQFPVSRNDTLFLYLSDAFFRQLASPQYRIEMTRRLRSLTEMQSLRLAQLAAAAEGVPGKNVDELIRADLLPDGFGVRADGSHIALSDDGIMIDSMRGTPGLFTPVPDVPIDQISRDEASEYAAFVSDYQNSPSRMDPMAIAIRRVPTETPGLEGITVDLQVAPLRATQFQRISKFLGQPRTERMAPVPGDLLRIEGAGPQNNYLFLGIQDFRPPLSVRDGRVQWGLPNFDALRGYLGGTPSLGPLESLLSLVFGRPAGPDVEGYWRWPIGLWQWADAEKTVLSFKRDVLDWVVPQLHLEDTGWPAQVRIDVDDISQREIAWAVNAYGYQHARGVSIGNTAFMQSLIRQLHAPAEECLAIAEELVGANLVCTLGGHYELAADGPPSWVSTAWSGENRAALTEIPADYVFPVLQWFRGTTAELTVQPDVIAAHVELLMQRKIAAPAAEGPQKGGFAWPDFWPSDEEKKPAQPPKIDFPGGLPEVLPPQVEPPSVELPEPEVLPPPDPKPRK